jgi:hypothetical protein
MKKMCTKFRFENVRGRKYLRAIGIDGDKIKISKGEIRLKNEESGI